MDAAAMEAGGMIRFGTGINLSSAISVHSSDEGSDADGEGNEDIKLTAMKLVAKRKSPDSGLLHGAKRRKAKVCQSGLPEAGPAKGTADPSRTTSGCTKSPSQQATNSDAKVLSIPTE